MMIHDSQGGPLPVLNGAELYITPRSIGCFTPVTDLFSAIYEGHINMNYDYLENMHLIWLDLIWPDFWLVYRTTKRL